MIKQRKRKLVGMLVLVSFMVIAGVASSWAAITYMVPSDQVAPLKEEMSLTAFTQQSLSFDSKAKAPEPATIALFSGGFISMLASFFRRTYGVVKRVFDIFAAIVGIIATLPITLITSILIRLTSKGAIFYSQVRVGKDGKTFRMYKFRTMKVDAEKNTGPVWASKDDNRLTPIGSFLRKMRIDELPQFINILQGDMSLIGPRPERPLFVNQLKDQVHNYEKRLSVKPGITGLAQVRHRYDESLKDVKRKVKYDLFYIKNMNIWHDMGIVFRTVFVVLTGFGAR